MHTVVGAPIRLTHGLSARRRRVEPVPLRTQRDLTHRQRRHPTKAPTRSPQQRLPLDDTESVPDLSSLGEALAAPRGLSTTSVRDTLDEQNERMRPPAEVPLSGPRDRGQAREQAWSRDTFVRQVARTPEAQSDVRRALEDGRLTHTEWRSVLAPHLVPTDSGATDARAADTRAADSRAADSRATDARATDARAATLPATPASRAVLDLWVRRPIEIDPDASRSIATDYLAASGYDVLERSWADRGHAPRDAALRALGPRDLERLERGNPAAPDALFETLRRLSPNPNEKRTIAIVDRGANADHPALAQRIWRNPGEIPGNLADDDRNGLVDDVHGPIVGFTDHGTMVAGTATRNTDQVEALLLDWSESVMNWASQVDYAAKAGATSLTLSMLVQGRDATKRWLDIIDAHPNILFVKSAGNYGNDLRSDRSDFASDNFLPRNLRPNLIVVANALENGDMADDATFGAPFVTLAAQGTGLMTVRADGGFIPGEGSSNAAPNVANLAAKCSILAPHLTPSALKALLIVASTPTPAWEGRVAGGGIVDHDRALYLAALSNLIHSGRSLDEAKQQLALTPERAAELMAQLRRAETM